MLIRLLTLLLLFALACGLKAQTSIIDPSFGDKGYASHARLNSRGVVKILLLKDSGFVVLGNYSSGGSVVPTISKYNKDGDLDDNFAAFGVLNLSLFGNTNATIGDGVLADSNKLIIAGANYDYNNGAGYYILKLDLSNGEIDPSYGNNGKNMVTIDPGKSVLTFLRKDRNENLLLGLLSYEGAGAHTLIYKFERGGKMDSAILKTGYTRLIKDLRTTVHDLLVTADNHYILIYHYYNSRNIVVESYDSNGNIDKSPLNGKSYMAYFDPYYFISLHAEERKEGGFYVSALVGNKMDTKKVVQIFCYDKNGDRIMSYGINGIRTKTLTTKGCNGIEFLKEDHKGRLLFGVKVVDITVVDGFLGSDINTSYIYRLKADGADDPAFNDSGVFCNFRDNLLDDELNDIAILPDDRILAAGDILDGYITKKVTTRQFVCRLKEHYNTLSIEKGKGFSSEVIVFPVPFSTFVLVKGIEPEFWYVISDMAGKELFSGNAEGLQVKGLERLSKGIYFLALTDSNKQVFKVTISNY